MSTKGQQQPIEHRGRIIRAEIRTTATQLAPLVRSASRSTGEQIRHSLEPDARNESGDTWGDDRKARRRDGLFS